MDDEKKQVRWLLTAAAVLFAAIIFYNLFLTPRVELIVVESDLSSQAVSSDIVEAVSSFGRININTASVEELDALPGIGAAIAQRIVDYREENGPFQSPADLQEVQGIGGKAYEKLKDFISVE